MAEKSRETARRLGVLSLIPLWVGVLAVWMTPWLLPASAGFDFSEITLFYAAIMASYFAGAGAGGGIAADTQPAGGFVPGLIAAGIAWVAIWPVGTLFLKLTDPARYALVIGALAFLLARDLRSVGEGAFPAWYGPLRIRLTLWAALCLILILARRFV